MSEMNTVVSTGLAIRKQVTRFETVGDESTEEHQYVCFPTSMQGGSNLAIAGCRHAICKVLKRHGIVRFDAEFTGGGDSGYVESVVAYNRELEEVEIPAIKVFQLNHVGLWSGWAPKEIRDQVPEGYELFYVTCVELKKAIEDLVWNISRLHMGGGWENNDGGSGDIRFNVLNNTYSGDTVVYYTESEHNEIEG